MNHFIPYTPNGPKPFEPKVFLTPEEHDTLFPKLPYSLNEADYPPEELSLHTARLTLLDALGKYFKKQYVAEINETDLEILAHMFINSFVAMKKRQKIETENQDPE